MKVEKTTRGWIVEPDSDGEELALSYLFKAHHANLIGVENCVAKYYPLHI